MPPIRLGVVAVLQDAQGRHLYIRRALCLVRAPGVWCFVGGEVEPGEPLERAVEREVREEVGLVVKAEKKIFESLSPNGEFQLHWMRVQPAGALEPIRPDPREVAEYCWLFPAEALRLDPMLPTLRTWLENALRAPL